MKKLSILPILFVVCVFYVNGVKSVYFTKPLFRFGLPASHDNIIGQVVALPNSTDRCPKENVIFKILQPSTFTVNTSGWIRVAKGTNSDNGYNVTVLAGCSVDDLATNVSVQILPKSRCVYENGETIQNYARDVCFQKTTNRFNIEENTISSIGRISPCLKTESFVKREFEIAKGQVAINTVSIHRETGEIQLIKSIDREKNSSITFMVNCRLTINRTHIETTSSKVVIDVIDLNDNPPFFSKNNRQKLLLEWRDGYKIPMQIMLYDKDIVNCHDHKVDIVNNGHPVCSLSRLISYPSDGQCVKGLRILVDKNSIPEKQYYSCQIYIKDPMYSSGLNKPVDLTEVEIEFRNEDKKAKQASFKGVQASIYKHASALSRVVQLNKHGEKGNFFLKHSIFNITKNDGIIYVDNATNLNTRNDSEIALDVLDMDNNKVVPVQIFITGSAEDYDDTCDLTCARSRDSLSCIESCGLGSQSGKCFWRRNSDAVGRMSKDYETCTPNVTTCPDFKCDELERLYPLLCPQDCSEKRHGAYVPNDKFGILMGKSPCWCDYDARCTCLDDPARDTPNPSLLSEVNIHINYSPHTTKPGQNINATKDTVLINIPKVGAQHSEHESCGEDCRTTIAATVGCLGAIICIVILTWRLRRRHCKSGHTLKHVGSVVSMSAVPSDYFDDRDYRTTHSSSSPQWSPKRQPQYYPTPEDKKWEFQRDKIDLEKTLGEGEFGRVVQAKYYEDDNRETFKYVAIKMLKTGCASTSEEQDLWSEFNLLKDVNHPNVVRLLGACINGGPFYLIVEYCEKGSLLHYLRNSRLEENGYVNNRIRHRLVRQEGQKLGTMDSDLLTNRDLLSFAWQIAKGMRYLSEIKLVHRDLAARNVLVASNKVLKISDFGLTRDVYEADTYLKRSKGRIPVKWLAPESLYAQIYTTQSDVWSYGIVLWEIVTLGAPPYPGIPPERLYNLLMAGYRMDRPEMCTDELYAVMQKCWKAEPQDRPIFADLANIFDRMLEQKTDYLDLSNGFEDVTSEVYDRCFGTSFSASTSSDNQPPKPVRFDNDKYGSIVSSNVDSYLTPSNSRDRLQQSCRDGYNAMSDSLNDASNSSSPSEQDKLCISVEKCAVAFTNSPEEDIESDETDLLHAKMV